MVSKALLLSRAVGMTVTLLKMNIYGYRVGTGAWGENAEHEDCPPPSLLLTVSPKDKHGWMGGGPRYPGSRWYHLPESRGHVAPTTSAGICMLPCLKAGATTAALQAPVGHVPVSRLVRRVHN